jgi:hypothetical protein
VRVRQVERLRDEAERVVGQMPVLLLREVQRRHHHRLLGRIALAQRRDLLAGVGGEFE